MLGHLRALMARITPDRYKVPAPCPPSLIASNQDRAVLVFIAVAAAALLASGHSDALALETVFGAVISKAYLGLLVLIGVAAIAATCTLTLGHLLRIAGVVIATLACAALGVRQLGALMPAATYLVAAWYMADRGGELIDEAERICERRTT